ncbi:hypothetical protein [Brevundimonas goettingensis]|uniref:Uncharacterized protein n=1 Tax=Brevundimonas goettingensis TaxID=2774190 RepID=A0A975C2A5_9CAUL|nr:hypothetical protein [Brevundimonas goettingensis]QTC92536.1 hypothetical protein IFJ75_06610 [Brevundimonas goettingensis]
MFAAAQIVAVGLAALALTSGDKSQTPQQTPPPAQSPEPTTAVDDIDVVGSRDSRLEQLSTRFVDEVAAPAPGRGLARWMAPVCVGVVNFRGEAARMIADRVASTAADLGVPIKEGDCAPNIFIVGTADGPGLAQRMVADIRADFAFNASGVRASNAALSDFETSDDPVRWWHVSMPMTVNIVEGTAGPAVRFPGRSAPFVVVMSRSQNTARRRDDLFRVTVVVDVNRLEGVSIDQLCDYLVMVAFAQVDPRADTAPYDTILNLFDAPGSVAGLTEWDRSYLAALYSASPDERLNGGTQAAALVTRVREGPTDSPD